MNTPAGNFVYAYDNADRLTQITVPWTDTDSHGTHRLFVSYGYYDNNWLFTQASFYNTLDQNGSPITVYLGTSGLETPGAGATSAEGLADGAGLGTK